MRPDERGALAIDRIDEEAFPRARNEERAVVGESERLDALPEGSARSQGGEVVSRTEIDEENGSVRAAHREHGVLGGIECQCTDAVALRALVFARDRSLSMLRIPPPHATIRRCRDEVAIMGRKGEGLDTRIQSGKWPMLMIERVVVSDMDGKVSVHGSGGEEGAVGRIGASARCERCGPRTNTVEAIERICSRKDVNCIARMFDHRESFPCRGPEDVRCAQCMGEWLGFLSPGGGREPGAQRMPMRDGTVSTRETERAARIHGECRGVVRGGVAKTSLVGIELYHVIASFLLVCVGKELMCLRYYVSAWMSRIFAYP